MANEYFDAYSPNPPFAPLSLRTRSELIAELSAPCGRFKSTITGEQRMRSYITRHIEDVDILPGPSLIASSGMPLNWQQLLNYLHENSVVAAPELLYRKFANDRPKFFNFQLNLNYDARPTEGRREGVGFGAAFSCDVAISKTIGEALERYFLSIYSRDERLYRTSAQLRASGKHILDIAALNGFLPWQKERFPRFISDETTPFFWVGGEEFPSGRKTFLPSQLVFWNYIHESSEGKEKMLARMTTSGCAGHFSKDEAVLSGLLENIQRDGFLIYWLNTLSPKVLNVAESDDPDIQQLLGYLGRYKLRPIFLNTTTDIGIPSMICALEDVASGEPIISIGGGAGFDLKSMLLQSAIEAMTVSGFIAEKAVFDISEDYRPFSDTRIGRTERLNAWKGTKMLERFEFFTSGEKQSLDDFMGNVGNITEIRDQLAYVLERFRLLGEGYETYIYEVNEPVLKNIGYHVVRTIVPQLVPLYLSEYAAPLDSKRLREVPAKLGFTAAAEPNPWPHPFP
jgi:ribosomal protein S12 methylthiotransferase accessory factor